MINKEVLELVKEQESYRDNLIKLMDLDILENDNALYDLSEILLNVNLISLKIRDIGITEELHDLYANLAYHIQHEEYLECKDIYEKINNYNA